MLSLALTQKSICCFYPPPVELKEAPDEIDIPTVPNPKSSFMNRLWPLREFVYNGSAGSIQQKTPGKGEHWAQQQLEAAQSMGEMTPGPFVLLSQPWPPAAPQSSLLREPVWQSRFKRTHSLRTRESFGKQPDTQLLPSLIYSDPSSIITSCFQNFPPSVTH